VILRRLKKAAAKSSSEITPDEVRKLAPFKEVHQALLESLIGNSRLIRPNMGSWVPENPMTELYFLRRGNMTLREPQMPARKLSHDKLEAAYPIPTDEKWAIEVGADTEILVVPARYLEIDDSSYNTEKPLELTEDDAGGAIYLQFYEAVKDDSFELPSLPDLAVRIGKTIDDPNTLNEDIARLIQMDPALAARVMGVVNSAAFGAVEPIRTLNQAVARMGRQQVRNLVFSCIIKGLFRTSSPVLKKQMKELWQHSARVAAISFILARVTPGLDPNRALLAGLIHDIGAIPVLQLAQDNPAVSENPELLESLINSLKGEVGALTLSAWHFDAELSALPREAEHWKRVGSAIPDYLDVVLVAQLHSYIGRQTDKNLPLIDQIPAFQKLALGQLTPRHSVGVLENASKEIEEVESMLSMG